MSSVVEVEETKRTVLSGCKSLSPTLSYSLALYVSFSFFSLAPLSRAPLTIQAQGGLEELKATEQKKNRNTGARREREGVERKRDRRTVGAG